MNDRTVKLFQNNVVMNKAEYARMLFEKGAAPGISSGQTQGKILFPDAVCTADHLLLRALK